MSDNTSDPRFVILISGNGSNLQAILDAIAGGKLQAQVAAVISNQADAYGLTRASNAGIPTLVLEKSRLQTREEYDRDLAEKVSAFHPDYIILAGWLRILSRTFLNCFPDRVINLHPALPGTFPGLHAIEKAYQAYQRGDIQETGVMVHLVPDEAVDAGPVLAAERVPINPKDTLEELETRIHTVEHRLLVAVLAQIIDTIPE